MKHLEMVEVHWLDSQASVGWQSPQDLDHAHPVVSVGFIARESQAFLTLAISYDHETDEWNPLISIPKIAITKRKRIQLLKLKAKA